MSTEHVDTSRTKHAHGKTAKIESSGKQPADAEGAIDLKLPAIDPSNPPSNKKILDVLDTAANAIEKEKASNPGQTSETVKVAEEFIEDARDLTKKKNKGEHLQKAFEASARAAKNIPQEQGSVKDRQNLAAARPQMRHNIPRLTRDVIFQMISDQEFRAAVSGLLKLLRQVADADPSADQHIPDNYHADPSKPALKQVAITPTDKEVVKTTVERVPIEKDTYEYHYTALTPEFRRQLADSFNESLKAFGKAPKQREAISQIFELFDIYHQNIHPVAKEAHKENDDLATARSELKKFVANFVEDKTLKDLLRRLKVLTTDLHNDQEFRKWVGKVRRYAERLMDNPDRDVHTEKMEKRVNHLIDEGHRLMNQPKYRDTIDALARDWQSLVDDIKEDNELNAFNKSLQKMYDTLYVTKKDGSATLDFNALMEMRGVFLTILKDLLHDLKLPEYSGSEGNYDFKLSGATISVADLIPDQITIVHQSEATVVMPKSEPAHKMTADDKSRMVGKMLVRARGICAHVRNAHFWFSHNSFPKTEDSGIAEMDLVGRGMDVEIEMFIKSVEGGKLEFQDGQVWVHIDKFKLKLHDTKHHAFYAIFKRSINSRVSQMVTQHIADMIAGTTSRIVGNLNELMAKATPDKFAESFLSSVM